MKTKILLIIIIAVSLVSCAPASTPARTSTVASAMLPTATLTLESTTTLTPVPANTDIPTPTATFTSAPSPTSAFTPTLTPEPGTTSISAMDGMVMAYIPAGSFQMGSNRGVWADEEPVHSVTLHAFWMDTTEVTIARFIKCVDAGKCLPPINFASSTRTAYYGNSQFDSYPVIYVRWDQALSYCRWAGRRLPTEAEWEYAARGGLEAMEYPWGDEFNGSKANFCDRNCPSDMSNKSMGDGFTETAPVRSYSPNNYGLYDMAGNVAELVNDWFGSYSAGSVTDPSGPASGDHFVIRGGSWSDLSIFLSVASRGHVSTVGIGDWIGFRCASDTP